MARYFQTGDALLGDYFVVALRFPNSQLNWVYGTFLGALYDMGLQERWITGGETSAYDASELFQQIYNEIKPMLFIVGMIADFPAVLDPATGWLPCDGALYFETDYPALFGVIGTTFNQGGDPSGQFRVPDNRGRVRITKDDGAGVITAMWGDTIGGIGGAQEHTLSIGEIPAHSHTDTGHAHSEIIAAPNVTTIGAGAPQATAIPGVGLTGSGSANLTNTGGDNPHNNIQPSITYYSHILARL